MLKLLYFLLIPLLFTACSYKDKQLADLKNLPQDTSLYTKDLKLPNINQNHLIKEFKKNYFNAWDLDKLSFTKEEAFWARDSYFGKEIYLENYKLASKEWFNKQIDNSNMKEYNRVLKKALLTKNSDFKLFPTNSKLFFNPKKAGEGFPFDYNQNTRVKINTPVLISHYSKDKAWAFVESNYVLGWVRIDNLLIVNEKIIKEYQDSELHIIIKEGFEIFDSNFSEDLKIGTLFPKLGKNYLIASNKGIKRVKINKDKISKFPLDINSKNITKISNRFINEPYGWGGANNHRDCSSFTQDFFSSFGIYLKRNSEAQTKLHKYIDLSALSNDEKKAKIKNKGIAFLTLIYLKGHIMLYIGTFNNEPLVMHNIWGIKTFNFFKEGRNIIGKTVITSLEPGIELVNIDSKRSLLKEIQGMVLLNEQTKKAY